MKAAEHESPDDQGESARDGYPDHGDFVKPQGVVAWRVMHEGTPLQTRPFLALEREPGGQYLILHAAEGLEIDFEDYLGTLVRVEGHLWTSQAITVESVVEVPRE